MMVRRETLAYTVKEAAELCGLSPDMIYELCRQDAFPHIRVGTRKIIVPKRRLEAWLNGGSLGEQINAAVESRLQH